MDSWSITRGAYSSRQSCAIRLWWRSLASYVPESRPGPAGARPCPAPARTRIPSWPGARCAGRASLLDRVPRGRKVLGAARERRSWLRSSRARARVEDAVEQVDHEVDHDEDDRREKDRALHDGVVAVVDGLDREAADPRPGEDRLGDDRPAEQRPELEARDRHDRERGVLERGLDDDEA